MTAFSWRSTIGRCKTAFEIIKLSAKNWAQVRAPQLSAALAFFTMLSLSPLLVVATSVAGFVYENEFAQTRLIEQVRDFAGEEAAVTMERALENANFSRGSSIVATVTSLVFLLFGAALVFVQLQRALNAIWRIEREDIKHSSIVHLITVRARSMIMVLVLGFLLLVSLTASAILTGIQEHLNQIWSGLGPVTKILHVGLSFGVLGTLFAFIFRLLPDTTVDSRAAWIGGLITVALLSVSQWAISLYLGHSSVGSAYGAAGSLVIFLLWIYATMMIVFFGAELTHVLSERASLH